MELPIRPRHAATLTAGETERIAERAARLVAGDTRLSATVDFAGDVAAGTRPGSGLFYEDHATIGLAAPGEEARYEYRMRMLAGSADWLLLGAPPHPGFDAYCRDVVGLGDPTVRQAPVAVGRVAPLPSRCRTDPDVFARLTRLARDAGGLTLAPYACGGDDWLLASALARAAGVPVRVAGPPPGIARRVNDKGWFVEQLHWLLGRESVPPTYTVLGPAALAGYVGRLARRVPRIVIKVPDSAGSKGNLVLESSQLAGLPLHAIHQRLRRLLCGLGWRGRFPLIAGVWESRVVASPSAQLWIPSAAAGPPAVEGLFVQTLAGAEGEFIGAEPARLAADVEARMVDEALRIGTLFQRLGYFGRCSLDAVLVGEDAEDADLRWIECNGRWGGVSIPLALVNRLAGSGDALPFVVVQELGADVPAMPFDGVLRRLAGMLWQPGAAAGIVLLSPRLLESGQGLHFVVLAPTIDAARALVRRARRALLATT